MASRISADVPSMTIRRALRMVAVLSEGTETAAAPGLKPRCSHEGGTSWLVMREGERGGPASS